MKKLKIIESSIGKGSLLVETDLATVSFAEAVMWKRKEGKKWEVITMLVEEWARRWPKEYLDFKKLITEDRESLLDKKFGQTNDRKSGMERRWVMVFPMRLQSLIRTQYTVDECPFDRAFNRMFRRKFPFFAIAEKD